MLLKAFSEDSYLLTMESYALPSLFAHCGLLLLVEVCWDKKMLGTSKYIASAALPITMWTVSQQHPLGTWWPYQL